jgi:hypothetical protein
MMGRQTRYTLAVSGGIPTAQLFAGPMDEHHSSLSCGTALLHHRSPSPLPRFINVCPLTNNATTTAGSTGPCTRGGIRF